MDISVKELFEKGRTWYNFAEKPVSRALLEEIYNLTKMGPTSANCCPLRIIFIESKEAKQKLATCVMEGNVPAVMSSPVTAIFTYDSRFFEKMPQLFPHNLGIGEYFKDEKIGHQTAFRNSSLQAAYFMVVARSKGLSCGPMSGFDPIKIETSFLAGTHWKPNFICNLGYAQGEPKYPRLVRPSFDEVCKFW